MIQMNEKIDFEASFFKLYGEKIFLFFLFVACYLLYFLGKVDLIASIIVSLVPGVGVVEFLIFGVINRIVINYENNSIIININYLFFSRKRIFLFSNTSFLYDNIKYGKFGYSNKFNLYKKKNGSLLLSLIVAKSGFSIEQFDRISVLLDLQMERVSKK